ncbi:MAG: DNA methyltransferase [Caldilineaceae bacterium]|nr:DNA methyltransferase [Caldilineaceae bacterium]
MRQHEFSTSTRVRFDPLIATYQHGKHHPLHHWYPFLEAFSPQFVETVLDRFIPNATIVLDPFGGSGTTPLVVAGHAKRGLYCELNPVLQFVTRIKFSVLKLNVSEREELADAILDEAYSLRFNLSRFAPDPLLGDAYSCVFPRSKFFSDDAFQSILQIRTYVDAMGDKWPLLSQVFTLSVLSSIVPSSLMKRAGDLRYKSDRELEKDGTPVEDLVAAKLYEIASDIEQLPECAGDAILLTEDARQLGNLPCLEVDAVITSPPYLNGTNYIRNTKLELWFLRALSRAGGLAIWRDKAITGGINGVTKSKADREIPSQAADLVKRLASDAYDSRIPRMVGTYFSDMKHVFRSMAKHLKRGSVVAIDIGDSRYNGIHVETDSLLVSIADELGYRLGETHVLRERKSRDQSPLKQSLLVLEYYGETSGQVVHPVAVGLKAEQKWTDFKRDLPHQKEPYSKRNWGHPLHSLCSYEGKMKPSLAHFLADTFVPSGGVMADPFVGVGTIPFEACLQGKKGYGIEISPAAYSIAKAKLKRPDLDGIRLVMRSLGDYLVHNPANQTEIDSVSQIKFNKTLNQYYHPETLSEVLSARRYFGKNRSQSVEHNFVLACLLHILHGNRPYALSRRSHPITPFAPTGPTEYRSLTQKLQQKIDRSIDLAYPEQMVDGEAFHQDATLEWPYRINNLDAVLTSPPFFDSTRYYLGNWIRLWFSGWEKGDFQTKPLRFFELRQKETMRVYEEVFRQSRERLKADGVLVLHLGKSNKADMACELQDIAKPWFRVYDMFEESVTHTESHGVSDKGRVTRHQYLILN